MKKFIFILILLIIIVFVLVGCRSKNIVFFRIINLAEEDLEFVKVYLPAPDRDYKKISNISAGEETNFYSYRMYDSVPLGVFSGSLVKIEFLFKGEEKEIVIYEDMQKKNDVIFYNVLNNGDKFELTIKSDEVIYHKLDY
ncbi:hypothetical protein [Natronospora cellulosivora (SeqCode)]